MSDEVDAQFEECTCGHARAEHGPTWYSGCNYTETRDFKGRPVTAQCPCRSFYKTDKPA